MGGARENLTVAGDTVTRGEDKGLLSRTRDARLARVIRRTADHWGGGATIRGGRRLSEPPLKDCRLIDHGHKDTGRQLGCGDLVK